MDTKQFLQRALATATTGAIVAVWAILIGLGEAAGDEPLRFERDVWPILAARCVNCHGGTEPKGSLDLRTVSAMLHGGDSGPAAVQGDPAASLLLERIDSGEMPPRGQPRISADEVAVVRAWIGAGLAADHPDAIPPPPPPVRDVDRQFWAFRPLGPLGVPPVAAGSRVRTAVDAFLLARLEPRGLSFSADAEAVTLLRRAYLDLLGLPPSPANVDEFFSDNLPDAYERLIDRLLASPHFGERWGRHWLDVAGYADTVGFDVDANLIITSDGKWLYRDYVIRSFNADKPYDRFIMEQIAGDELYDWRRAEHFTAETREALIATGYLRTARDLTHEDVGVIPQNFYGIVHDTIEIVGTGLLGLTVNCARCHSHKFDPIPQEDYYRLSALFTPAYNPHAWRPVTPFAPEIHDRSVPDISPVELAEGERHNAEIDGRVAVLQRQLADVRRPYVQRLLETRLAALPEVIRADTQAAIETPAEKRNEVQKYLAGKFAASLTVKPEEVAAALDEADKTAVASLEAQVAEANSGRRTWGKLQALFDVGPPPPTYLLTRGNYETPGAEVAPGFLRMLCRSDAEALAAVVPPAEGTSGRRMAFARWLTSPDSPAAALLARVLVNRLWHQLFGRGIVPTLDNFGAQGQRPTHPELLDWLSREFMRGGWRIKPVLKLLMTSTAYRQASQRADAESAQAVVTGTAAGTTPADPETIDPGNELLWKMRLRRLESEVVRDAILSVGGNLNRAAGGPPVLTDARPDGMVVVAKQLKDPADPWRRSVYLLARRAYNLSLLTVFDQPLVATNCLRRDASAVPLQSLTMLNDEFVGEQAAAFAGRVESAAGTSPHEQVEAAFRLALARRPNADESAWCRDLLQRQTELYLATGLNADAAAQQALVQLCHTLLDTSEFLYVE